MIISSKKIVKKKMLAESNLAIRSSSGGYLSRAKQTVFITILRVITHWNRPVMQNKYNICLVLSHHVSSNFGLLLCW